MLWSVAVAAAEWYLHKRTGEYVLLAEDEEGAKHVVAVCHYQCTAEMLDDTHAKALKVAREKEEALLFPRNPSLSLWRDSEKQKSENGA